MLIYDWSGVVSIYKDCSSEVEILRAEIDTDHMKTNTKGPRGRPVSSWDFIFSPEKFDKEIGLEQFRSDDLGFDKMQQ